MSGAYSLLIPVAVARAVVESKWFKDQDDNPPNPLLGRFLFVLRSSGRTRLYLTSVQETETVIYAVEQARLEQTQAPVISKIEQFKIDLEKVADQLARRAGYEKEQQEKQLAQMRAQNRIDGRKHREQPMSMYVEAGQSVLTDVAEDYGLTIKDHQIRAALVAAYRAGALAMQQSTNYLMIQRNAASDYSAEDVAKWNERNRVIFERVAPEQGKSPNQA